MVIIKRRGDRILPEQLDIMCHWIEAREALRCNRESNAPKPWTDDCLLSTYRWCNVRRMDDRVSKWLLSWHQTYPDIGFQNRLVAAVAGRLINWPGTLQDLSYPSPYLEPEWTKVMLARKRCREKVFTGAYIINGALGGDKILQVTQKVLAPLWKARRTIDPRPQTMQEVWKWFNGKPGLGSFMAGQAVADLRHIHPELPWTDRLTWAPQGPGSIRGVNRLIGQPLSASMPYNEWLDVVRAAYARCAARLPAIYKRLELMDQQNVFCEYDKYVRLTNNEGSVRSRYREFKSWT
jgi:alpha-glutamyl/putrescinyl thymine pyrophosphorylase clade 1